MVVIRLKVIAITIIFSKVNFMDVGKTVFHIEHWKQFINAIAKRQKEKDAKLSHPDLGFGLNSVLGDNEYKNDEKNEVEVDRETENRMELNSEQAEEGEKIEEKEAKNDIKNGGETRK